MELIFVMILCPLCLNTLQFWFLDWVLKIREDVQKDVGYVWIDPVTGRGRSGHGDHDDHDDMGTPRIHYTYTTGTNNGNRGMGSENIHNHLPRDQDHLDIDDFSTVSETTDEEEEGSDYRGEGSENGRSFASYSHHHDHVRGHGRRTVDDTTPLIIHNYSSKGSKSVSNKLKRHSHSNHLKVSTPTSFKII